MEKDNMEKDIKDGDIYYHTPSGIKLFKHNKFQIEDYMCLSPILEKYGTTEEIKSEIPDLVEFERIHLQPGYLNDYQTQADIYGCLIMTIRNLPIPGEQQEQLVENLRKLRTTFIIRLMKTYKLMGYQS